MFFLINLINIQSRVIPKNKISGSSAKNTNFNVKFLVVRSNSSKPLVYKKQSNENIF